MQHIPHAHHFSGFSVVRLMFVFWSEDADIILDRNILILALTSCFFEGSLFLFIFFKFPALKLAHKLSGSTDGKHRPMNPSQSRFNIVQNFHSASFSPFLCAR